MPLLLTGIRLSHPGRPRELVGAPGEFRALVPRVEVGPARLTFAKVGLTHTFAKVGPTAKVGPLVNICIYLI